MIIFNVFAKIILFIVTLLLRLIFIGVLTVSFIPIVFCMLFGSDVAGALMIKLGNVLIKNKI